MDSKGHDGLEPAAGAIMSDAGAITRKARAEVENVIDEVVQTIENGVSHSDDSAGFEATEADRLRADLREFAEAILEAARENTRTGIRASTDKVVDTIRRGIIHPPESAGFGPGEAEELRTHLQRFADAIVTAARTQSRTHVHAPIDQVVKTIRSGLFHVYGRASYAAITADQLEAYLETFVDAVLAVLEKSD